MRQDLKPTRAELRDVKRRLQVVQRGHRLLKRKQDSLMVQFYRGLTEYRRAEDATAEAMRRASAAMTQAEMAGGRMGAWSFALTRAGRMGLRAGYQAFMGVALPDMRPVETAGVASGLLPGEPPQNYEAANAAEDLLRHLVVLAAVEARVRVILMEVERTKRRVNALEMKVLPQLERDRDFIQSRLDEMERESLFALKRVRSKVRTR